MFRQIRSIRLRLIAPLLLATLSTSALAYIGPSFMQIPGVDGGWQGEQYNSWLRFESHQWKDGQFPASIRGLFRRHRAYYSYPATPRAGASVLTVTMDKGNPALPRLMALCAAGTNIPELTYAESATRIRPVTQLGALPDGVPDYFEYRLVDVTFSECPVVEGAPEQAFMLAFNDIEWLNVDIGEIEEGGGVDLELPPAQLAPLPSKGETLAFVMSWFEVAHDVSDDQCSALNTPPPQEDYYTYRSAEEAERERARLADQGGPDYEGGDMELRGPAGLNACQLPGILPDPGHVAPQPTLARGLNLDGGTAQGSCATLHYAAVDGRTNINNQLYTVEGCSPGYQGRKGFLMQYRNEQMRNGLLSPLLLVSGIDDRRNDDSIFVTILYSKNPMAKSPNGSVILSDYTFSITDDPEYAHYFTTLPGRIEDGVIITELVDEVRFNPGLNVLLELKQAGLRLEFQPDGGVRGVLAGYLDWRKKMTLSASSNQELLYGYQCPGMYNAFKRAADGLPDPVTGECNGISAAYDIEAVPAFIPPAELQALMEGELADRLLARQQ